MAEGESDAAVGVKSERTDPTAVDGATSGGTGGAELQTSGGATSGVSGTPER